MFIVLGAKFGWNLLVWKFVAVPLFTLLSSTYMPFGLAFNIAPVLFALALIPFVFFFLIDVFAFFYFYQAVLGFLLGKGSGATRIHKWNKGAENIYGFSKLAMDRIARRWYDKHPAAIIGLRYFNVYGPGETHKNERDGNKTASMILQLYEQLKAGRQPRLFKYGEQLRDFVYIRDVIGANLSALDAPRSGVCNVGSGRARSFNDIINTLTQLLDLEVEIEYFDNPFSEKYQDYTQADTSLLKKTLKSHR